MDAEAVLWGNYMFPVSAIRRENSAVKKPWLEG